MSKQYEVEIKSLLGTKDKVEDLKKKISEKGGDVSKVKKSRQLNHYFTYSNLLKFHDSLIMIIPEDKRIIFSKIIFEGKNFSIRTREINDKVILVIKASLGEDSSSNGVSRMEFESEMGMTLASLDKLLLDAGLKYQAKWSREREEYSLGDIFVCIDKNAGYGYVVEFEKVVEDESLVLAAKAGIVSLMNELGIEELAQDRLERMFAFYNDHWSEYYGTENTFTIE